ncbi:MAG: Type 1 glutamine amidotransferase-like domain-containing protein [Anaerolineales bacterium]|nr:Type 1 glutamine amidotransferase-like domain-containing protein [Anaerolineales bacterium]
MPPINLHLFSTPGKMDIGYIVEASRPYLENKDDPMVAFLPLASLYAERWLEVTKASFKNLGRVENINAELMSQKEIEAILRDCSVVYISGGNTFLLNHRLHASGIMPYLKKKIQSGLPLVGFSAGAMVCGPNILSSFDMNTVGTTFFDGLKAAPFNFSCHYPLDGHGQSMKDEWLRDYHFFNDNPILMMCDNAYVRIDGAKATLVRGEAYIWRKDEEKEKLEEGKLIKA